MSVLQLQNTELSSFRCCSCVPPHPTLLGHRCPPHPRRPQQRTNNNTANQPMATGGGTFVSKSGKVQHFAEGGSQGARGGGAKAAIAIPEEALPSGETLDRQLEAVTISESEFCAGFSLCGEEDRGGEGEGRGGRGRGIGCERAGLRTL